MAANVPFKNRKQGMLQPALKVKCKSKTLIDYGEAGRTNVVYIRNLTTGQYIRAGTGAGVSGTKGYLQLDWQAGDTDQVAPISVVFVSTDANGISHAVPTEALLLSEIEPLYVLPSDREVTA